MEKVFSPKLFGLIKDGSVKKNLSKDILAGIVVGIVALPLAIAFAVAGYRGRISHFVLWW